MKVAVIAGGPSREATVSRSSAAEVSTALRSAGHDVCQIELDHAVTTKLLEYHPDVVFPVLHGPPGEDGTIQGYLEIIGLAYVGSGVHASAAAMDKSIAKSVFRRINLPVCDDLVFPPGTRVTDAARAIATTLGDRVVIKPLRQGSAIGVTPIMNGGDLIAPLELAFSMGDGVLVEPFVLGMEATVGVLDVEGTTARAFPPIEINTPSGTWYDFQHRYTAGESAHVIPARLPQDLLASLESIAIDAHRALGCRDLSRADFIVTDQGRIVLLEVNSLPGMTPTSLYPDGAKALGIDFTTLMDMLVQSALRRVAT